MPNWVTVLYILCLALLQIMSCQDMLKSFEEMQARKNLIKKLDKIHTALHDGYEFVSRNTATVTMTFKSYRNVAVMCYQMPTGVSVAQFTFQVEDVIQGGVGKCEAENVKVHLKHGSFPAVNPDGYPFPRGFIEVNKRDKIHNLTLRSSGDRRVYTVRNPMAGRWYAISFLEWEESPKIEQTGGPICKEPLAKNPKHLTVFQCESEVMLARNITPSYFVCQRCLAVECDAVLYTDLQVKRQEPTMIDCYSEVSLYLNGLRNTYKCITNDNVSPLTLKFKLINESDTRTAIIQIQAATMPSADDYLAYCYVDLPMKRFQSISFQPHPNSWHYIVIESFTENANNVTKCMASDNILRMELKNVRSHSLVDLVKDDKGMFFHYDYNLPTTDLQDILNIMNVSSDAVTILRFQINPVLDIGGTITLAVSMLMTLKYHMNFKRHAKEGSLLEFSEDDQFFKLVICLNIGHQSIPMHNGECIYNDITKPALFVVNSTDSHTIDDSVIIPFPEGGMWYMSMRLFCDDTVCPCRTSTKDSKKYYVESDPTKLSMYREASSLLDNKRMGSPNCNTMMKFTISSSPCVQGRCSNRGYCLLTTSGGIVMSSCYCTSGYGGWDCSNDSRMNSVMLSILLLTLSNLMFFFTIYVATIRKYYTEAVMYTFTMTLSAFYHACDAPIKVAFCIVNQHLLRFGDFYCGLMSFWVTLLAMSLISDGVRSVLLLSGAVVVACLVTWNNEALLSFMVPVGIGIIVIVSSWVFDYRRKKALEYPRQYYVLYLPLGIVFVSVGLVCYAFLQTEYNYKFVHSLWHMLIALAVVCLLPDVKRSRKVNAFLPDYHSFKFWNLGRRS